jgi:excisionase family DNA binding protein
VEVPEYQQQIKPLLLTMEEGAEALRLSLRYFYTLVLTNQVKSVKIGRSRRVPVVELQAFVKRQMLVGEEGEETNV